MKTILKGAKFYRDGRFETGDLAIEDGKIVAIGGRVALEADDRAVDLTGCHVLPGLVDVHVHLREPGFFGERDHCDGYGCRRARRLYHRLSDAESQSGSRFAGASGSGAGSDPPRCGRSGAALRFHYAGTEGTRGSWSISGALAGEVVGFSGRRTGGCRGESWMAEAMRRAAAVGKPIVAHCEVDELLKEGISTTVFIAASTGTRVFAPRASGGRWSAI